MTRKRPPRILPSKRPITPHIKSSRTKRDSTTGCRRKDQCGTSGTTSRHRSHSGLAEPLCRASETGRRVTPPDRQSKKTRPGVPARQNCTPPAEPAKVPAAASREPSKGCSSRERRSAEATRKTAALGRDAALQCPDGAARRPYHAFIPDDPRLDTPA
jgi:hypothetical protein